MDQAIDFVITWVDGNDPAWREQMRSYRNDADLGPGVTDDRYRDWGILPYWFRGVDQFAPWVRTIHFVTWGHVPSWLDVTNPHINIVRHEDFIPKEYLPTFNSNAIELNLHRIDGLSEQFVYFNDDMFLCRAMKPQNFFRDGVPCDVAALNVNCNAFSRPIQQICFNNTGLINDHFDFKRTLSTHRGKWINPRYGKLVARTLVLMSCPRFPGLYNPHAPQPYLKSTWDVVWAAEPELLSRTCRNRFRLADEFNHWVFKDWQLATGRFVPRRAADSARFFFIGDEARDEADRAAACIRSGKTAMVCANDGPMADDDYAYCRQTIHDAFEDILPTPCAFERAEVKALKGRS